MFERALMDHMAPGQVRHHDGRHSEAELPVIRNQLAIRRRRAIAGVIDIGGVGVVSDLRRRHVVEEAAPLVERDHEDGVVQVTRAGEGMVGVRDEPLAEPDIRKRMIVS